MRRVGRMKASSTPSGGARRSKRAAKARPDGYTLAATTRSTITILPATQPDVTYKASDFAVVGAYALDSGVVFVKMTFSKFTKRQWAHLPWIGEELQIGLISVFVLLIAWLLARACIRYVDSAPAA